MLMLSSFFSVLFLMLLRMTASITTINIVLRPRHDETPIDDFSCTLSPDKMMKITLKPKGLNETNSKHFFQCGVDERIDPEKMVAEWNSQTIFRFIKSKDQTKVQDVIKFDNSGQPVMAMKEEDEDGVYSLFIVPPTNKCDSQSLDQAVNGEEGFYPVFIGASNNFSDHQNKFLNEIKCLEKYYGAEKPNLCSTKLPMSHLIATSRIRTMQTIYNFAYNSGRNVNLNKIKHCNSETETKDAIAKSNIFDIKPDCHFKETNQTVLESEGVVKAIIERETSGKKLVIMVKTIFSSDDGSADENDIVPYDNVIVFGENEKLSEVYISVKSDNVKESDEKFKLILEPFIESKRDKRATDKLTAKLDPSQQQIITIADMQCYLEEPRDPLCGRLFWLAGIEQDHLKEFLGPWEIMGTVNQNPQENKWKNRHNENIFAFKQVNAMKTVNTWVVTKHADANPFNKMDHCEMMKEEDSSVWFYKRESKWTKKNKISTIKLVQGVCENEKDCSEVADNKCDIRPDADLGVCRPENDYCKADTDCTLASTPTCNTETFTCVACSDDPPKEDYSHVTDLDCGNYECKCKTNELKRKLSLECGSFWYENTANARDSLGNIYQPGPELKIMIKRGKEKTKEGHFHLATGQAIPTIKTVNCPYDAQGGTDGDLARIGLYSRLVEKCKKAVNAEGFTFHELDNRGKKTRTDENTRQRQLANFQEGMWRKTNDYENEKGFFLTKAKYHLKNWSCTKKNVEFLLPNGEADIEQLLEDVFNMN